MFNIIDRCQEALAHQKFKDQSVAVKLEIEKLIRYTPVIADAKKHLENAEFLVRKAAATLVPMAVPLRCKKKRFPKLNVLFDIRRCIPIKTRSFG
jgi:hypothetical protein